ncbi:hypothetical protein [Ramlibacter sp. AN1133]|uniref:hypothetical protein n=1 Tax=Ramlibacter sp. AN1133 TaxID=3133429 RepID=UPI0030BD21DD
MQSTLRKPFVAAGLLLSCAAALLAQPAIAREQQWVVQAPAPVAPAIVAGDRDRDGHDGWRHGWRDGWRRDERAPSIVDLSPLPGERVGERYRMTVSARFADHASGVDPASVRLRIDGRDVTAASRVDDDEVRFHNNLFPGRHVAEVIVRDRAGNTARRSWQFDVVDRDRHGYGDGDGYRRSGWGWGWQR